MHLFFSFFNFFCGKKWVVFPTSLAKVGTAIDTGTIQGFVSRCISSTCAAGRGLGPQVVDYQ